MDKHADHGQLVKTGEIAPGKTPPERSGQKTASALCGHATKRLADAVAQTKDSVVANRKS